LGEGDQPASWGIDAGVEYSDNVLRTADQEVSDTIADVGVTLNLDTQRPRLDARASGNVQYREYLRDSADGEFVGGLNGALSFAISPQRLHWIAEENFGQVAANERAVDSPNNRQNINYFSTGPELTLPLGTRTDFQLGGRWSDVQYSQTEADSQRIDANLALSRQLSETNSLSLNASTSSVDFKNSTLATATDYDVREAFLRYAGIGRRTALSADVGYTELRPDGRETSSGPLVRVTLDRKIGARSSLSWNAGREFADSADIFRQDQSFAGAQVGGQDAAAIPDAFTADYTGLVLRVTGVRSQLSLSADWRREEHETQTQLDRRLLGAGVSVNRRLTPRWTANVAVTYGRSEFADSADEGNEWSAGLGLTRQLTQTVLMSLQLLHYDGSGSGTFNDYEENRAMLRFTYTRVL
jgi:hypothetical protein